MRVRNAETGDLDWVVGQLKQFSRFFGSKYSLFEDEEFARQGLAKMMSGQLLTVAVTDAGDLAGFLGAAAGPHYLNPKIRVLAELFWWVHEDHRGSSAGARLLNEFVRWGRLHVEWIQVSLLEGLSPIKESSLLKRGFKLVERSYVLEVA